MAGDGSQQRKPGFKTAVEDVKTLATLLAKEAQDILGRRTAQVLGVLVIFVVVVGTLLAFLNWYVAPSGAAQKQALVVTLAQILGGAALLSGVYFTWRTLQVNSEGQITERFTRAIDQLGATEDGTKPKLETRLGGIYALERIARDSEKDHWPIMQVLTAYVRKRAPWKGNEPEPLAAGALPPLDIQAILTVIADRERYHCKGEPEPLDLQGTDLRGSSALKGAHLEGAYLQRAKVTNEQLAVTWSLQGATMPDGSKHP